MFRYVLVYLATAVIFLALDFVWLGYVGLGLYRRHLGDLLLAQPNLPVAALFYIAYVVGILILAVAPALESQSMVKAAALGAVLGFIAYGTYDLTNLATLRDWSATIAIVDILWGTALTAVAASGGTLAARYLLAP